MDLSSKCEGCVSKGRVIGRIGKRQHLLRKRYINWSTLTAISDTVIDSWSMCHRFLSLASYHPQSWCSEQQSYSRLLMTIIHRPGLLWLRQTWKWHQWHCTWPQRWSCDLGCWIRSLLVLSGNGPVYPRGFHHSPGGVSKYQLSILPFFFFPPCTYSVWRGFENWWVQGHSHSHVQKWSPVSSKNSKWTCSCDGLEPPMLQWRPVKARWVTFGLWTFLRTRGFSLGSYSVTYHEEFSFHTSYSVTWQKKISFPTFLRMYCGKRERYPLACSHIHVRVFWDGKLVTLVGQISEESMIEVAEEQVNGTTATERGSGNRRQLWSFSQDCWKWADFRSNREEVRDMSFLFAAGVSKDRCIVGDGLRGLNPNCSWV